MKKELFEEETPLRDPKILETLYYLLLNSNVSADLTVKWRCKTHGITYDLKKTRKTLVSRIQMNKVNNQPG